MIDNVISMGGAARGGTKNVSNQDDEASETSDGLTVPQSYQAFQVK